jgi:hypothetical protein
MLPTPSIAEVEIDLAKQQRLCMMLDFMMSITLMVA